MFTQGRSTLRSSRKEDREIVLAAVTQSEFALEYASEKLKEDRLLLHMLQMQLEDEAA